MSKLHPVVPSTIDDGRPVVYTTRTPGAAPATLEAIAKIRRASKR